MMTDTETIAFFAWKLLNTLKYQSHFRNRLNYDIFKHITHNLLKLYIKQ